MRTLADRIRHVLLFESFAILIFSVFGSWVTQWSATTIGALGLTLSLIAMGWNFIFNWIFDAWDRHHRGSAKRGVGLRIVHAVLFEGALLICSIFILAWWLQTTLWQSLGLSIGASAFFVIYAFAFNWLYDIVFPPPQAA